MGTFKFVAGAILMLSLIASGCTNGSSRTMAGDEPTATAVAWPDFRKQGPVAYDSLEGKLTSSTGCEIVYTFLRPEGSSQGALVVLGHGFLRAKNRMADLAGHMASWGLPVVNIEFCNFKLYGRFRFEGD